MFNDSLSRGYAIKVLDEETAKAQGIKASRGIIGILSQGLAVDTVVEVTSLPANPEKGIFYLLVPDNKLYIATDDGYLEVASPEGVSWDEIVDHPTKLSEFENDGNGDASDPFPTTTEVRAMISEVPVFDIQVVSELPQNPSATTIYLVPSQETGSSNIFAEYIYVNNTWEKLGEQTAEVDLSEYAKIVYVDAQDAAIEAKLPLTMTQAEYESLFA